MVHPQFPLIAQILKDALEPRGFHVHMRNELNEVMITDVVGNNIGGLPSAEPTFVVWVGTNAD